MLMRWWQQHLLLAKYHHIEQQTHEEINRKRFSGINFRSSRKTFPSSQHTLPPIINQAKNRCIYRQPNGLRRLALLMGEVMAKLYSFTSLWQTEHYVLCSRSRVCSVEYRRDGIHLHFIYVCPPTPMLHLLAAQIMWMKLFLPMYTSLSLQHKNFILEYRWIIIFNQI